MFLDLVRFYYVILVQFYFKEALLQDFFIIKKCSSNSEK